MAINKFAGVFDEKANNNNNVLEQNPSLEQVHITSNIDCLFDPDAKDERGIFLRHLDPRPDLEQDHELWTIILNNALLLHGLPENLYGTLHFLRASGAGLKKAEGSIGLMLIEGSWDAVATGMKWEQVKAVYLEPIREGLIKLFSFTKEHGMLPAPGEIFNRADRKEADSPEKKQGKQQQQRLVFGGNDPK
jgi:hypothetical protein